MTHTQDMNELMAALLAERYGPLPNRETSSTPPPHPGLRTGGSDTPINQARRRRILCEALDDRDPTQAAA